MAFVHLHTHTEFSLLDGAARVPDLIKKASALGMPALAITDHGYMYGVATFFQECQRFNKEAKKDGRQTVKPILGCECYFEPNSDLPKDRKPDLSHLILLSKNYTGYQNLMAICSDAAVRGYYYKPRTTLEMLRAHSEGLIATSACMQGIIPRSIDAGDWDAAVRWTNTYVDIFGKDDFYIELQDQGISTRNGTTQHQLNVSLARLARECGLKTVATNDIHYVNQDDWQVQDLMLCIGTATHIDDENRMHAFKGTYLKSEEEMRTALGPEFSEACDNTLEIAEKCNVELEFGKIVLPHFPLNEGETNESRLRMEAEKGLKERYGDPLPDNVRERFEYELDIICKKGFAAYFLIVQEFARWAKDSGIGVGPGRGSAAGSIISYALDITTFDPLANDLMFERFLSPERTEMPDIDMDFDDERRLDVVEHVRQVYGAEKIAHVITFSTMKAKQAVNDAARVLGYSMNDGQRISKLIPADPHAELDSSIEGNPDLKKLYQEDANAKKIIDAARSLEGITRGEGVHASAVIICRDAVEKYVPVKYDTKGGVIITQFDGTTTADMGLLKMDFLGLRTLTLITKTKENIKATTGQTIDENKIPFDDPAIYDLFASGDTEGVFQVESPGMCALLKNMKPDCYDDIVALIALYRPGPLNSGMVTDFVDRKLGKKKIVYYDDRLKDILESTYGTIVYQEQVMRISMKMSGFSAGESDKVRKAVAKKHIELMQTKVQTWADGTEETMEAHWMNGAVRNGFALETAQKIWDDVLKFAQYAFNKSHSAAYARITMETAWFKAHYPHEFMAAVLTTFQGKTDKIVHYIAACRNNGIPVLPPDVNSSRRDFTPTKEGVRFGLAGVRGVGEGVADAIIEEREKNGLYQSLHDYVDRVDAKLSNRRVVEALIKSGAFDSTGYTRRQLMEFVEEGSLLERAARKQRDRDSGQVSMFDMFGSDEDAGLADDVPAPDGVEWDRKTKLAYEKEMLGRYVSDHPLSPYMKIISEHSDCSMADIDELEDGFRGHFSGMMASYAIKPTKKGTQYANFTLEDVDGEASCSLFGKAFEANRRYLKDDAIVCVEARVEKTDRGVSLNIMKITPLDLDDEDLKSHALELHVAAENLNQGLMDQIVSSLERYPGRDKVTMFVSQQDGKKFRAELPPTVNARSGALVTEMSMLLGQGGCMVATL